jgi:hypothetical protein
MNRKGQVDGHLGERDNLRDEVYGHYAPLSARAEHLGADLHTRWY